MPGDLRHHDGLHPSSAPASGRERRRRVRLWAWRLAADQRAATAIEYALLAALIGGVLVGVMSTLGQSLTTLYGQISSDVTAGMENGES